MQKVTRELRDQLEQYDVSYNWIYSLRHYNPEKYNELYGLSPNVFVANTMKYIDFVQDLLLDKEKESNINSILLNEFNYCPSIKFASQRLAMFSISVFRYRDKPLTLNYSLYKKLKRLYNEYNRD